MSDSVEPRRIRFFTMFSKTKPYQGTVNMEYFNISRIIGYRNSFLPYITGRVEPLQTGSEITVIMTLHPFVMLFMAVWLGFTGLMSLLLLPALLFGWLNAAPSVIPLIMLLFGYLLCTIPFRLEAIKSRKFLVRLLGGGDD